MIKLAFRKPLRKNDLCMIKALMGHGIVHNYDTSI